jgi:hypothetical protein
MTTAREMAEALKEKLPGHTFKAVMLRAKALNSEEERRELLAGMLQEREDGKAWDEARAAALRNT